MMRLYHGSLVEVREPQILIPNRTLDFGTGFYTTTNLEQASQWVQVRKRGNHHLVGYINIYEFSYELNFDVLSILRFDALTDDWIDFVMQNRMLKEYSHSYDIVIGPVANDRVYACFNAFENGFMDKATLLRELKTYTLVDQVLFHTQESLQSLTFIETKEV